MPCGVNGGICVHCCFCGGSITTTGKVATGDSTNVAMLLLILAAAAGVVVFARKRVEKN